MPGTLTVPNSIGAQPGPTILASLFDQNWATQNAYINIRQITRGLLAARPAPGPATAPDGTWYFATDVSGGTLQESDGSNWQDMAPGLVTPPPAVPGALSEAVVLAGTAGGTYSTASAVFVDMDAVNLKTNVTVAAGAKFIIVAAWYMLQATLIADGQGHVQILAAGSGLGPYSVINNGLSNPAGTPQTVFGVLPNPPAGVQSVALQFRGDGANAVNIANPPAEGMTAPDGVIPRMLVLVTT